MSGPVNLEGYVDVPTRLRLALDKHPDLRIQEDAPTVVDVDGHLFVSVKVTVWRTPDDPLPAIGTAWEPFPGRTPYTRDSEMMNASTSALGRALGFMGFGIDRSIATANEVTTRVQDRTQPAAPPARVDASPAQIKLLRSLGYAGDPTALTKREAMTEIDRLKASKQAAPPDHDEEPF